MKLIDKIKNIEINWERLFGLFAFIFIVVFFFRLAIYITGFIFP